MVNREAILARWGDRDSRYETRAPLSRAEVSIVRATRLQEAGSDPALREMARSWSPPRGKR